VLIQPASQSDASSLVAATVDSERETEPAPSSLV